MHAFALIATLITSTGEESFLLDYNLSGVDCVEAMEASAPDMEPHGLILSCEFYYGD